MSRVEKRLESFFRVKGLPYLFSPYDQIEVLPFEDCRRDENFIGCWIEKVKAAGAWMKLGGGMAVGAPASLLFV